MGDFSRDNMGVLSDIPITFDVDTMSKRLKIGDRGKTEQLITLANTLIHPRAVYQVAYVERKTDVTVDIGRVQFTSSVLRKNLDAIERVFPYILTVGKALEQRTASAEDLLEQWYLEEIADATLNYIRQYLERHLQKKLRVGQLSSMNPGSLENWPITQQRELFSIFGDTQTIIGVSLTDSFLMIPRKSVSGILFPTEIKFYSCQLCPRERCIRRKTPYDRELAENYRLL